MVEKHSHQNIIMNTEIVASEHGEIVVTLTMSVEEFEAFQEHIPQAEPVPEIEADIQPLGFWPKAHHWCVKVRNQTNPGFYCQTTIYESPLWAWARAVGIGLRKAGKSANISMSNGRCAGPQDSCEVR